MTTHSSKINPIYLLLTHSLEAHVKWRHFYSSSLSADSAIFDAAFPHCLLQYLFWMVLWNKWKTFVSMLQLWQWRGPNASCLLQRYTAECFVKTMCGRIIVECNHPRKHDQLTYYYHSCVFSDKKQNWNWEQQEPSGGIYCSAYIGIVFPQSLASKDTKNRSSYVEDIKVKILLTSLSLENH